jgi:hypothetical protein
MEMDWGRKSGRALVVGAVADERARRVSLGSEFDHRCRNRLRAGCAQIRVADGEDQRNLGAAGLPTPAKEKIAHIRQTSRENCCQLNAEFVYTPRK